MLPIAQRQAVYRKDEQVRAAPNHHLTGAANSEPKGEAIMNKRRFVLTIASSALLAVSLMAGTAPASAAHMGGFGRSMAGGGDRAHQLHRRLWAQLRRGIGWPGGRLYRLPAAWFERGRGIRWNSDRIDQSGSSAIWQLVTDCLSLPQTARLIPAAWASKVTAWTAVCPSAVGSGHWRRGPRTCSAPR